MNHAILKICESEERPRQPAYRLTHQESHDKILQRMDQLCQYYCALQKMNFDPLRDEFKAEVIKRHRLEWLEHAFIFNAAEVLNDGNTYAARQAKLLAETIKLRQEGERLAWNLDDYEANLGAEAAETVPPVINIVGVPGREAAETVPTAPAAELAKAKEKERGD